VRLTRHLPGRAAVVRSVCAAILACALAAPVPATAQTAAPTYRMCWLSSGAPRTESYNAAFSQRMRELGLVEGENLVVVFRSAEGNIDRLPALAAELARERCDAYFAPGTEPNINAITRAARDGPIVVVATDYDPIAAGYVASLARPGGRITGVSHLQGELPAKRLELLKTLLPNVRKVAVLSDPASVQQLALTREAAKRMGIELVVHEFRRSPYAYEAAFAQLAQAKPDALLALASGLFVAARKTIPALALKYRLPSMFNNFLWVEAGALISYGVDFSASYRRAGEQMASVLKGAKPAELPMEQASAVELSINLKTAKALDFTIPPSVLVRADRVIE
jgi:putative tryptophan/tyrosine transport system substrate-binding protein